MLNVHQISKIYLIRFDKHYNYILSIPQILQLYAAMALKQGILLTGISGTGKSQMYKILSEVLTKLHSKDSDAPVDDGELKATHGMVFQNQQKLKVKRDLKKIYCLCLEINRNLGLIYMYILSKIFFRLGINIKKAGFMRISNGKIIWFNKGHLIFS